MKRTLLPSHTTSHLCSLFQLKAPSEAWSLLLLECNAIPFNLLKGGLETLHSLFFKGLSKVVLTILTTLEGTSHCKKIIKSYRIDMLSEFYLLNIDISVTNNCSYLIFL